jgi:hypothetical protein
MCYLHWIMVSLDIFAIITLLAVAGFEPLTIGLLGECSYNVLLALDNVLLWHFCHYHSPSSSRIWTLDHRIMRQVFYQCTTGTGQCFVYTFCTISSLLVVAGFEPLTLGLGGKCSTMLFALCCCLFLLRHFCYYHSPSGTKISILDHRIMRWVFYQCTIGTG